MTCIQYEICGKEIGYQFLGAVIMHETTYRCLVSIPIVHNFLLQFQMIACVVAYLVLLYQLGSRWDMLLRLG